MVDNVTYDDEGNPMVVKSRPPRPFKAKHSFNAANTSSSTEVQSFSTEVQSFNTETEVEDFSANGRHSNSSPKPSKSKQYTKKQKVRKRSSFSGPSSTQEDSPEHKGLTAIFELDGKSYDVAFEETKISWSPVGGGSSKKKGQSYLKS